MVLFFYHAFRDITEELTKIKNSEFFVHTRVRQKFCNILVVRVAQFGSYRCFCQGYEGDQSPRTVIYTPSATCRICLYD